MSNESILNQKIYNQITKEFSIQEKLNYFFSIILNNSVQRDTEKKFQMPRISIKQNDNERNFILYLVVCKWEYSN